MNDDETLEKQIDHAWPDKPPSELRERILARVSAELSARPVRRRSWGWAVAAALLLALGLNAGAGMLVDHRVAYYRETAPVAFQDLARRSSAAVDASPISMATATWIKQGYDEPELGREDFERYLRELLTRTTLHDVQHLP